jgi:hypothetical protein
MVVTPTLQRVQPLSRPRLDSSEHDGTLGVVGTTIRGELAGGSGVQPHHNLVSGRPVGIQTMMHTCASTAKLRGGGPILSLGIRAMTSVGTPPPRTVIGNLSPQCG